MKKLIIYLTISLLTTSSMVAQEFEAGTNIINAGVGFGGYFGYNFDSSTSQSPVFSVSYERGIWDVPGPGVVSLGGYFGRKNFKLDVAGTDYKWSYNIIGVRGAYHYNGLEIDNLDVYGGVMTSFNIHGGDDYRGYGSKPSVTPFVGGRWFFSDNFAAYVEGSYGVAFLSTGVSFRF